jgi:hypothetical protein
VAAPQGSGIRAIVLPGADSVDDLLDLVSRLSFYLAPAQDWTVTIPTAVDEALALVTPASSGGRFTVPAQFDPRIQFLHEALAGRLIVVDPGDANEVRRAHAEADVVFVRNKEGACLSPWSELHAASAGKRVYPVDPVRDRMEGSQYIQALFANRRSATVFTEDSRSKFGHLAQQLGRHPVAYLLATGPSIDRFSQHDFSAGVVIACNTTVLDDELLSHTRPQILTFADPIFHFGCSLYAAQFRDAVRQAAHKYDFQILIPLKYYELYTHLEPSLASRVIGVPYSQRDINLDLVSEFEVKVMDNIATFMMLPLATTFATSIDFLGFDGRKPDETYFWRHNPRTQLNGLMDNIKEVHPGFFDVQYEDYYDRHCQNLARFVEQGEALGKRFSSLEPSAIPVLASRQMTRAEDVQGLSAILSGDDPAFRVFSLNPDWVDDFGHYRSYDERMSEAVQELGGELMSVANSGLTGSVEGLKLVRCFSESTWGPGRQTDRGDIRLFEQELDDLLAAYASLDATTPTVFAMYVSSAWHLPTFVRLRAKYSQFPWTFAPNVFHMHDQMLRSDLGLASTASKEVRIVQLTTEVRRHLGIGLYADSVRLQHALHRHAGEWPALWPMFSTTMTTKEALSTQPYAGAEPLRVYCPANAQLAKGYDLLPALARAATTDDRRRWQLVTRAVVRPETPSRLREVAEELQQSTEALTGVLTHEHYLQEFRQADVILLPYRAFPFASRTSAVVSDAVLLGKPVVATAGTWAGNWVEQLGVGATFADGDVQAMLSAVRLVTKHVDHYREVAVSAREAWAREHSPMRLGEVLRDAARDAGPADVTDDVLREIREMTAAVAKLRVASRLPTAAPEGRGADGAATGRSASRARLLPLLTAVRRSQRGRALARRVYAILPPRMMKPIDDVVRTNPG